MSQLVVSQDVTSDNAIQLLRVPSSEGAHNALIALLKDNQAGHRGRRAKRTEPRTRIGMETRPTVAASLQSGDGYHGTRMGGLGCLRWKTAQGYA